MQSVDRDRFKVVFETVSLHHVSPNATHFNSLKIKVLYYIKRGYQFSMPWLLLIALGCYTVFSFFLIKSGRFQREWWVPNVLLFLVIVRVSMLSYITVTSFPAINVQYMSPLYPLLIVFLLVSLTRVQNFFRHSA